MTQTHFNLGTDKDLSNAYPFTQATVDGLGPNALVSPCPGVNHLATYGLTEGVVPGTAIYDEQHEDIEALRIDVESGIWPQWFLEKNGVEGRLSSLWLKYGANIMTEAQKREFRIRSLSENNPKACGEVVRMDGPLQFYDDVLMPYAAENGITLNPTYIHHEGIPFVETHASQAQAHAWIIQALRKVFEVKYFFGRARPSEYNSMGEKIAMYPSSRHAEVPAGHGTFMGASVAAFERLTTATESQISTVANAAKQGAMFRSFSAMHIANSNLLGYEFGYRMTMAADLTTGLLV